jgi:hypothetical protein
MNIPSNVLAFSQTYGVTELIESFADYYNQYKSEVMNKPTVFNKTMSFAEKGKVLHTSIEATIAKLSGVSTCGFSEEVVRTNPNYQWATFAVIGAMVDPVIADSVNDNFGRFAEIRNGGFGDSFSFDIKSSDLFITTKAGNGRRHAFAQRQHNGQATLIPENRMLTVSEDLYRILSGKRNLAEYAVKVALSFEEQLATEIYNAINDTYASLPAAFTAASFAQSTFIPICQKVKAFNGGSSVNVFGTQVALSSILPSDNYLKFGLGEEYNRTGYLTNWQGVSLFCMDQKADWTSATYATKLDDTRLYIIPSSNEKLVKVCIEGATISYADTTTTNANLVQKQTMHKRYGVGLISNAHYGILDLGE